MKTDPEAGPAEPEVSCDASPTRRSMGAGTAVGMLGLGAVLVLMGVGLVLALGRSGDDELRMAVRAGTNLAVSPPGDGLAAYNSPTVVASPTDPDTLVVAARVDRPQLSALVRRSDDGGESWADTALELPAGETRAFAPDLAFDSEGTLYAAFVTLSDPADNPTGLWLARSVDAGASFEAPTRVAGPYAYQPRVAVGAPPAVHVSWVQASAAVGNVKNGFGPPPNPVVVASSADAGRSFSEPATVSGRRPRVGAASPFVGPEGALFVLFQDFGDDAVDLEGRPGPVHDGRFSLVLARSDDDGESFVEASVVDERVLPTTRFNPFTPGYPSAAVDAEVGAIYVAYTSGGGDWGVFVRRSIDAGATWGPRVGVSPDAPPGTHQHLPTVSVAPDGRVDVAFLDRSDDRDGNVWIAASLATSFDEGRTWRTVAISDRLFDSRVGPELPQPGVADLGSRIGLVSRRDKALAVWSDTRAGTVDTGRQDLYFAPVSIVPE